MRLKHLVEGLPVNLVQPGASHANHDPLAAGDHTGEVEILDITDDSRAVRPGSLFIARAPVRTPGDAGATAGGARYIPDAIARGAVAILCDLPSAALSSPTADCSTSTGIGDTSSAVAQWAATAPIVWLTATTGCVDQALAGALAERFFGHPSRKLKVVAITGTKGKTTTAFITQHLLNQAGVKCGLIGTVINDDGKTRSEATLTTPGAIDFVRLLSAMAANGCEACVAEVSSHALHQGRVAALKIDVGVFTNLTGDHLDYHGTMEDYADAKAILFRQLSPDGWAVANVDDPAAAIMLLDCRAKIVRCRVNNPPPPQSISPTDCGATIRSLGSDHSRVQFDGPWGSLDFRLPLAGTHNVYNALQAAAAANCVVAMSRVLRDALTRCPAPPGRMQVVRAEIADCEWGIADRQTTSNEPGGIADQSAIRNPQSEILRPAVLVDYAHTHAALENVLTAMRPFTAGKLVVLFGCGGDRDRTKRPKMAKVCCDLADRVIITSDNPRTEEPTQIFSDILGGVPGERRHVVTVEPDRARAIELAILGAAEGDVVLLAGKGHENYQIIGKDKRHFDDCEEARRVLSQWKPPRKGEAA